MLRLPDRPTRTLLKSFWLVTSAMVGLLVAAALWVLGNPHAAAWGFPVALLCAVPGLWQPQLAAVPYRGWARFVGVASRGAQAWLTFLCFWIVAVVGLGGSRVVWRKPGPTASGWVPKRLPAGSYASVSDLPKAAGGGLGSLGSWGWRSGHLWVWSLLPLMFVLSALRAGARGSLREDVYTLY